MGVPKLSFSAKFIASKPFIQLKKTFWILAYFSYSMHALMRFRIAWCEMTHDCLYNHLWVCPALCKFQRNNKLSLPPGSQ